MNHQTNFETVNRPDDIWASKAVFWGGLWVAVGAFGVVITSVLYAAAPALAVLPMANVLISDALRATIVGQPWMVAAGNVGIFSDVAFATGALVLLVNRKPNRSGIEAAGWAWLAVTNLIFVVVDALVSHVLGPVALLGGPEVTFSGFKHLFDVLFVLGTVTFGMGSINIFWSEVRTGSPVIPKGISTIGIVIGAVGLVSSASYFVGINLALLIGVAIGAGSLIFTVIGIQIARTALLAIHTNTQPPKMHSKANAGEVS